MGCRRWSALMEAITIEPGGLMEKVIRLEERVQRLEEQNKELEFRVGKLTDVVLTADTMHRKLRSEMIRHDF